MSYEDITTIIFVAVQVVKKESHSSPTKKPAQAKLGRGTLDMDCAGVGHPPGEFQFVALLVAMFAPLCFWVAQRFTAAITALFQTRLQPLR